RRYVRFLRECRRHQRLHRELNELHSEAHDEGFEYRGEHSDTHDALEETHEQYHRSHPYANYCPSYSDYRRRYSYYRDYRWDERRATEPDSGRASLGARPVRTTKDNAMLLRLTLAALAVAAMSAGVASAHPVLKTAAPVGVVAHAPKEIRMT